MRCAIFILLLPALAFGHVTENEFAIIENMQKAAAEQAVLLSESTKEAAESKDIALTSIAGLKGIGSLADQMKAAIKVFQDQADTLAIAHDKAEKRADEAETTIAEKNTRILQLWISTSVLGLCCAGLVYLLFKP